MIYFEKISEVYFRVYGEPDEEQNLSDFFKFRVPGYQFTPQYKARLWDGYIRLYDLHRKTLYAGLHNYLLEFAERNQTKIQFIPNKDFTTPQRIHEVSQEQIKQFFGILNPHSRGNQIQIRDYQLDAVQKSINEERTLLLSPTASGKSLIIYGLLRWHLNAKRKSIIIVPTTSLVEQLYSDFDEYSSQDNSFNVKTDCQKLYSGFTREFTSNVLITTWQSIYKQPRGWFDQFDVVFGDEAHQFKAKSLCTVMEKMQNIRYRIGTTGTLDGKQVHRLVLEGLFGPVYKVTTTKELMESNHLANLNIQCILLQYSEEVRKARKNNTYQEEMDWIVLNDSRNKFIRNLALATTGNTLVLFQYVEKHGKELYGQIIQKAKEGRKVFFVYGGTDTEQREDIRHITEEENDAIIVASYGTFSTGINIPSLENIIFASPTKSKIRNLQSIGRGLRLKNGKTECKLFDIADDLHWKMWKNHTLNHFLERVKTYSEEKFTYTVSEVKL